MVFRVSGEPSVRFEVNHHLEENPGCFLER